MNNLFEEFQGADIISQVVMCGCGLKTGRAVSPVQSVLMCFGCIPAVNVAKNLSLKHTQN